MPPELAPEPVLALRRVNAPRGALSGLESSSQLRASRRVVRTRVLRTVGLAGPGRAKGPFYGRTGWVASRPPTPQCGKEACRQAWRPIGPCMAQ